MNYQLKLSKSRIARILLITITIVIILSKKDSYSNNIILSVSWIWFGNGLIWSFKDWIWYENDQIWLV